MHSNAANIEAFSYAACFGRDGSFARHMVKLLMAAWMMFGMATSAQAVVEQEAPIPGACFSSSQIIGCTPSVRLVADTSCLTARGGSPINITRIDFTTWSTDCQLGGTFRIIGSVSCPVPTVNPTVPYSYNANTSMCEREQQVQYTISLHNISPVLIEGEGLGGEMAPNASRNAYANVGVPGVAITLTTAAPFAAGSLTLSPHQGSSGVNGRLNFIVTAPSVGGTHTVTATCDGGKCSNQATGTIVVTACPVPPLRPLPANDACTASLEKGFGKDVDGACPKLSDNMKAQMQCFADKITATNVTASPQIPYAGPTATYRTTAYQAHLQEIWDKMIDLDNLEEPAEIEACKIRRSEIVAAKGCNGGHCLEFRPADDSKHSIGQAFDISKSTIQGLLQELTPLPSPIMSKQQKKQEQMFLIASWLAQPTACNLTWGGSFNDRVHFQLP